MFKKIIGLIIVPFLLQAANLTVQKGTVQAHTEVFGDSHIDPSSNKIIASMTMDNTIESLKGTLKISVLDLKSSKTSRDEHMYKALEAKTYPNISVMVQRVSKKDEKYFLEGTVTLHGVTKPFTTLATISTQGDQITLKGTFSISMKSYGIKPIKLLFLTVRDQVDIIYDLTLG